MKKKVLLLITGNSSWWKEKKYRKESALILKKHRSKGWKLQNKVLITKHKDEIDSRNICKYILVR